MSEFQLVALAYIEAKLRRLLFKLSHPLQITNRCNTTQQPRQLGVPDNMGLQEDIGALGVEPTGNILSNA